MFVNETIATGSKSAPPVDLLLARRAVTTRNVAALHSEAANAMGRRDLSDLYDDETVADADVGVTLSLAITAEQRLDQFDDALARVGDGTYGRCSECDEAINLERLRALPATTRCIACARGPSTTTGLDGRGVPGSGEVVRVAEASRHIVRGRAPRRR